MGFLNFILLSFDFLAWPVFALCYPLCASIRAIESGSKYHMRKLVIYWTLFSLISLFELTFVKILHWIPFWSFLKLVVICWLVIPQFNRACYAYQSLVNPILCVNLRKVVRRFYKPKEENLLQSKSFLDVADQYIKENGFEALENLIATKRFGKEPEDKYAAVELNRLKEPDSVQKDKEIFESTQKIEAKPLQHAHSNSVAWIEKKETTQPPSPVVADQEKNKNTPPINNVQREWTCALCLVTTTSEKTLNAHLQGSKHKAKCEALRASKYKVKDNGDKLKQNNSVGQRLQQRINKNPEERVQQKMKPKKDISAVSQKPNLFCGVCDVKLPGEVDLVAHLKGKRHLNNMHKM